MADKVGYEKVHIICRDVEDRKSIIPDLETFVNGFDAVFDVFKIGEESRDWVMIEVGRHCGPFDSVLLGTLLAGMGFKQDGFTNVGIVRYVRKDDEPEETTTTTEG